MNALLPHFRSSYLPCSLKLPAVQVFIAVWEVSHHIEPANCILRHFFIKWLLIFFYYKISREKLVPEPRFEPRISRFLARRSTTWAILVLMPGKSSIRLKREIWTWAGMRTRIAQVVECLARNLEVRGSKPGSGSSFSLEIL